MEKYSNNGRQLGVKFSNKEIADYLGIEGVTSNEILEEFKQLEEQFLNDNVDFWLNEDIDIYANGTQTVYKGQYISVVKILY